MIMPQFGANGDESTENDKRAPRIRAATLREAV